MAARKSQYSDAKLAILRERVQAGMLLTRLLDHALGNVEMTATQITAANILLKKVMPDLTAVEHSGEVTHRQASELSDDELRARIAELSARGTAPQTSPQLTH